MKDRILKDFIRNNATEKNLCYKYEEYPREVRQMLENVFKMCWRIGLYASQTMMMLDESLKPFKISNFNVEELLDL